MAESSPIGGVGGVGGASAARSVDKLLSNVMLDVFQQSLKNSGVQTSPETQSALQSLRDAINGNQHQASQQMQPPAASNCGSPGAGGPEGAGAAQGPQSAGQGDSAGLMQMLMQLLQMVMQMLSQMQGGGQGSGANAGAGHVAQQLPQLGMPMDDDQGFDEDDLGMGGFDMSQQGPQQLM